MTSLRLRAATVHDAENVALLHAGSWRRHYRGAYADSFLDGDIAADRRAVWSSRLADADADAGNTMTAVAEDDTGLVGFVHVVFDHDDRWGSLVDNLHVTHGRQRTGIGTVLLGRAAQAVARQATSRSMYLWVLEQNTAAQQFYRACGGAFVERATVPAPGGVPARLNGVPGCLRVSWPDAALLAGPTGGGILGP